MPNKFITILYNDMSDAPTIINIPYSKEWMEKLTIANGAYINYNETSPEQEKIIDEIEQRFTTINDTDDPLEYFDTDSTIPREEIGSWAKYVLKFGEEIPFNSVGCFILGAIY